MSPSQELPAYSLSVLRPKQYGGQDRGPVRFPHNFVMHDDDVSSKYVKLKIARSAFQLCVHCVTFTTISHNFAIYNNSRTILIFETNYYLWGIPYAKVLHCHLFPRSGYRSKEGVLLETHCKAFRWQTEYPRFEQYCRRAP